MARGEYIAYLDDDDKYKYIEEERYLHKKRHPPCDHARREKNRILHHQKPYNLAERLHPAYHEEETDADCGY